MKPIVDSHSNDEDSNPASRHTTFATALLHRRNTIDDSTTLANSNKLDDETLTESVSTDSLQEYVMQAEVRLMSTPSTPLLNGVTVTSNDDDDDMVDLTDRGRIRSEDDGALVVCGSMPAGDDKEDEIFKQHVHPSIEHSRPSRLCLFSQNSVTCAPSLTKHSHTEQVMMMHALKTKLARYQTFIDKAFALVAQGSEEAIIEGCTITAKVLQKSWIFPKISHDLASALCESLREVGYLDKLIQLFVRAHTPEPVRLACGRVLEECLSLGNRDYIVDKGMLKKLVATVEKLTKTREQQRMSIAIMEGLFKHSTSTSYRLIEYGALDHILLTCKRATDNPLTLRHAALALANLALYSCGDGKKKIVSKNVPDWLFLLASQPDDITRYYACLAICMLGSTKESEAAVIKSGTMTLVEPFLLSHQPDTFAAADYKYAQGWPKEWLERLLPMLQSKCHEAKSMAAYHFTMEATIKKEQQKLEVFEQIGAIEALKEVASSPDEVAAKFASEALTIIGETVPHKLTQQVPYWSIADVQHWVTKIGFESYKEKFSQHMVDGDLLLLITEKELECDIGISSSLLRKRFLRELESLKIAADYGFGDETQLDQFLMSLSPELSIYTYQMLEMGLNRNLLPSLTDEMMQSVCGIRNPIHRLKLRQALQDSKHIEDIEVAVLSKNIDVFISYRRSTGNQLASLIKVLLQLRGYKVFIDVDKLYAGKFDSSLLKNIQAAKHFILVLTPNSLDRLLGDTNCNDWVHKELRCAFEHNKNVIPIFDQHFELPSNEMEIPLDIRPVTRYNGVRWVHEYQEACMDKVERFIKGELNRTPSIAVQPQSLPIATRKPSDIAASSRWPTPAVSSPRSTSSRIGTLSRGVTDSDIGCNERQTHRPKHNHSSVSTICNGGGGGGQ